MAETEAQKERAEADLREQRAQLHERGMADDELIEDHERDRFAGTSAMRDEPAATRAEDRPTHDDRAMRDDGTTHEGEERPMHEPATEYEQGRVDEAREREGRFNREPERADDPTRSRPA
jgi:hypothetical protein